MIRCSITFVFVTYGDYFTSVMTTDIAPEWSSRLLHDYNLRVKGMESRATACLSELQSRKLNNLIHEIIF